MRRLQLLTLAVGLLASCDKIAGLKPPSPTNAFIKATTTLSKLVVPRGDTMRFSFSVENITTNALTLTTSVGCQIKPELDQVAGDRQRPLLTDVLFCPDTPTVRTLAVGEKLTFSVLLRSRDPNVDILLQKPGYILKPGVFDASVLVNAAEIGGEVRSDWVRFEVK